MDLLFLVRKVTLGGLPLLRANDTDADRSTLNWKFSTVVQVQATATVLGRL